MGKNKSKELVKNTAIISFGKICTQLVSFLLMPFYTSILSTQEYGIVDLVVTYGQLLLPVFTLQMEQSLFRFLIDVREDEEKKSKVISSIISLTILLASFFSIIFIVAGLFISTEYKYFLLGSLWSSLFINMLLQMSRGLGKNKIYALGSFCTASGQVLLNIVFVLWLRKGASGMILAMIVAQIATSIFLVNRLGVMKYFHFSIGGWDSIKGYIGYSMPLVPNAISWWILNASDRSIILKFLGVGINGIYSAANKFSGIYTTIFNIFNLSWIESVALYMKGENAEEEYTKIQNRVIGLCITAASGIIFVMPFVFNILVNVKFADAFYQIPILVMGAFFSSMVGLGTAYYLTDKKTVVIARTTVLAAICNIGLNLSMVTHIGLYAASISTVLAYFILFIIRAIDIKKRYNVRYNYKLLISGIIMMMLGYSTYFIGRLYIYLFAFLIFVAYAYIINLGLLKIAYKMITDRLKKRK